MLVQFLKLMYTNLNSLHKKFKSLSRRNWIDFLSQMDSCYIQSITYAFLHIVRSNPRVFIQELAMSIFGCGPKMC